MFQANHFQIREVEAVDPFFFSFLLDRFIAPTVLTMIQQRLILHHHVEDSESSYLNNKVTRIVFRIVRSLWHLTGTSAAVLPMWLSKCKAIRPFKVPISWLRDFTRSCGKTSFRVFRRGPGGIQHHNQIARRLVRSILFCRKKSAHAIAISLSLKMSSNWLTKPSPWALSYYNDLTLSHSFELIVPQLSKKAALPLAKILATASCCSSKTRPWLLMHRRHH